MALVIFIDEEKCSFQKLIDDKEVITQTHKLIATKRILFTTNPRLTRFLAPNTTYEDSRTREVVHRQK